MNIIPFATPSEIEQALPRVLDHLRSDRLIAYPTETVYGFGGAATKNATGALRALKRREAQKPFLLLVSDPAQVSAVHWPAAAQLLADMYWPGPLTLALPAERAHFPAGIVSDDGLVALRATPHPALRTLLASFGAPITSTSANEPGQPAARTAAEAARAADVLGARGLLVLDGGELVPSPPSTVVACAERTVHVLRAGAVSVEDVRARLEGTGINVD